MAEDTEYVVRMTYRWHMRLVIRLLPLARSWPERAKQTLVDAALWLLLHGGLRIVDRERA